MLTTHLLDALRNCRKNRINTKVLKSFTNNMRLAIDSEQNSGSPYTMLILYISLRKLILRDSKNM